MTGTFLMGRKAQHEIALTAFPVMVLLVLMIAVFLVLTVAAKTVKPPQQPSIVALSEDVLLQKVRIPKAEGIEQMLVLEAVARYHQGKLSYGALEESLKELVRQDAPCLILAQGVSELPSREKGGEARDNIFLIYQQGKVTGVNPGYVFSGIAKYVDAHVLYRVTFSVIRYGKEESVFVESYLGRCL